MEPSPSHKPTPPPDKVKESLKAAHELWALACWATLRATWKKWEMPGGNLRLPPKVEEFFGWYCHKSYLRWMPIVEHEIQVRPEKQKEQRKKKADEARPEAPPIHEQSAKMTVPSPGGSGAGSLLKAEKLDEDEEIEGIQDAAKPRHRQLAQEEADFDAWEREANEWQDRQSPAGAGGKGARSGVGSSTSGDGDSAGDEDDTEADVGPFSPRRDRGNSGVPGAEFHSLYIPEPKLPEPSDVNDNGKGRKRIWEAWEWTLVKLLMPTKEKGRILMAELFKQALSKQKKTSTPSEMLSCLTGYLKAIVREAVRETAKEARTVVSTAQTTSINAPVGGFGPGKTMTGGEVIADTDNVVENSSYRELEELGVPLGRKEFENSAVGDDVRLGFFAAALKKLPGRDSSKDEGFSVGLQDAAILIELKIKSAQLYKHIEQSEERLKLAAISCLPKETAGTQRVVEAHAHCEMMRLCTEWFWSEKIRRPLFEVVMAHIQAHKDNTFACPHTSICMGAPETVTRKERCWGCPRQKNRHAPLDSRHP